MSDAAALLSPSARAGAIAAAFRAMGEYFLLALKSLAGGPEPGPLPLDAAALAGAIRWEPLGRLAGNLGSLADMQRAEIAALFRLAASTLWQQPQLAHAGQRVVLQLARDHLGADPSPRSLEELRPSAAGVLAVLALSGQGDEATVAALADALLPWTLRCGDQLLVAARVARMAAAGLPIGSRAAMAAGERAQLLQLAVPALRPPRPPEPAVLPTWRPGELAAVLNTWTCGAVEAVIATLADPASEWGGFPCPLLGSWLRAVGEVSAARPELLPARARISERISRLAEQFLDQPAQALKELETTTGLSGSR